jgi:hypothetical protein
MLNLFCGYDDREAIGYHVFCSSVISRSSIPVAFIPSNKFTVSRFAIPALMNFTGKAIFMDASDMLMLKDISLYKKELDNLDAPVAVVKHGYKTINPVKYVGTEMECSNQDYDRKNWASMMLINCEHPAWRQMTMQKIADENILDLLQFKFLCDFEIAELDESFNVLVDENQNIDGAKLLHWTAGIPYFDSYKNARGSEQWWAERNKWNS